MNRRSQWVAPSVDGSLFIDPPLDRIDELLAINRRRLAAARCTFLGRSLTEVRLMAADRIRVLTNADAAGPFAVAGHQPELFHPGVWIKNFVLNRIARRLGLSPLNVMIDGDTLKSVSLPVPATDLDPARVHRHLLPFDAPGGEVPYADRRVRDPQLFDSFARRLLPLTDGWSHRPLLMEMWPEIVGERQRTPDASIGELFAAGRRRVEQRWGCANLEVSQRRLGIVPEMIGQILADLPRFHAAYNEAVRAYRRRYHVRSQHHPAPDLAIDGDRIEAPLWWIDSTGSRRERLFVRRRGNILELTPSGGQQTVSLPSGDGAIAEAMAEHGVMLGTRALTTTLLLRLGLADLFIHGIGGAKYDEVTDEITRRYFALEPPEYLVVTGTLRLPLPRFPSTAADRHGWERRLRDLRWHPEQFLGHPDEPARRLAAQKQDQLARAPQTADEKRRRYRELLHLTESLRGYVTEAAASVERRLERTIAEIDANDVLSRRDYSFVLYPEALLRSFCTQPL